MAGVLDFESVSKDYGQPWSRRRLRALDSFTLSLEPGEILGFLGPNGAGKTTAIHLALGFMRPTSGSGRLLGRPFGEAVPRRRVGFLPENVAFYHRPAETVLRFYGALSGMRDPLLRERCRELLRAVELEAEGNRNVGRFSRGMQQRIGLAQVLLNDPDLLILDEPTSALDPLARVSVRELLLQTNRAGKTIFLSSHLLSEVERVCHRIAIIHSGRIVEVARTADLLTAHDQFEIVARGVDPEVIPGIRVRNGNVVITVAGKSQREAIERVWALGGEIVSVNPARRTLEEVFVAATRDLPASPREGADA